MDKSLYFMYDSWWDDEDIGSNKISAMGLVTTTFYLIRTHLLNHCCRDTVFIILNMGFNSLSLRALAIAIHFSISNHKWPTSGCILFLIIALICISWLFVDAQCCTYLLQFSERQSHCRCLKSQERTEHLCTELLPALIFQILQ